MSAFVIIVDFKLNPGTRPEFRKLIDVNAQTSVRDETGCRRFDVLEPEGESDRIVLYEIYDSRADLEAHIATEHYKSFDKASAAMVAEKTVTAFALACEGGA
ncbi:MAG: putative quinol monooxygenase [Hyphomicrobiaceae bacterium]